MSNSGSRAPVSKARPAPPAKTRGGPARAVSELLPDVSGAAFRKFGFVQSAIVGRWAEIVGSRYAAVSIPESIRFPRGKRAEGTLCLTVKGAHGPMMQHIAPEIIERVNRFFGYAAIVKLAIRQGEITAQAPRQAPPSVRPVPIELGQSLRAIADPEFKAVLEALAAGVATTSGPPLIGKIGDK